MKAYRNNGMLVIEVSEGALLHGATLIPGQPLHVTDPERYLNWIAGHVMSFGDDGDFDSASELTRLFDRLAVAAAESDAGCEPANASLSGPNRRAQTDE